MNDMIQQSSRVRDSKKKGFKLYSIVLQQSSGECARKVCGKAKAKRNQNIIMDYLKNPVIEVYQLSVVLRLYKVHRKKLY